MINSEGAQKLRSLMNVMEEIENDVDVSSSGVLNENIDELDERAVNLLNELENVILEIKKQPEEHPDVIENIKRIINRVLAGI